jgi:acyl-coenzyme A thioesterase PaaI-like protein
VTPAGSSSGATERARAGPRVRSTVPPSGSVPPVRHPDAPAPGTVLSQHYAHCFGCGDRHPTGLHLHVTVADGVAVTGQFTVTPDHQGAPGLAHGGLLTAAFDEVLGSLMWLLRVPSVTARLETDFLRPVPVGSTLFIDAMASAVKGRQVFTEAVGRLGGTTGDVAVRARALFVQVDIGHFTSHGRQEEIEAVRRDPTLHRTSEAFEVNP